MLNLLLIGRSEPAEMQPIRAFLARECTAADLRTAVDLDAALRLVRAENWFPDLVVVLQNWPDEYSRRDIEALIAASPLARIVCCYGAWCDSDGRTRTLWPPAVRVSTLAATLRLQHELELLRGGRCGPVLPLTGGREEIFAYDHSQPVAATSGGAPIAVISPDAAYAANLQTTLRMAGFSIAASSCEPTTTAVVWDIDPWNEGIAAELTAFQQQRSLPILALMGFPRSDEIAAVKARGATAVIPKLGSQAALIAAMQDALAP